MIVRHRIHQSLAIPRRALTHYRINNLDVREPYPVLEVTVITPGLKSHHKPGDVVLWAEEDTFQ